MSNQKREGGQAVATRDLSQASWRKSSRSGDTGNCVEIAHVPASTGVRDSKNPHGGLLVLSAAGWGALRSAIDNNQFGNA